MVGVSGYLAAVYPAQISVVQHSAKEGNFEMDAKVKIP